MDISKQLTQALVAYLTRPGARCSYGVGVSEVAADRKGLVLVLTFRSGQRYCCPEPGCHFGPLFRADWDRLRSLAREAGVELASPLTIPLRCVYEGGALFAIDPGARTRHTVSLSSARSRWPNARQRRWIRGAGPTSRSPRPGLLTVVPRIIFVERPRRVSRAFGRPRDA